MYAPVRGLYGRVALCALLLGCLLAPRPGLAEAKGFQLNRYEPTPAGEWSFLVDHPWFSSTRRFAAGLTLNYAHDPLVYGLRGADGSFSEQGKLIEHQLLGHLDLALSLFDRLTFAASLPVTLLERGEPLAGIRPLSGGMVGDPRFSLMVRLWGQPDASPFSVSLGAYLWAPVGLADSHAGDAGVRVLPKLVLGGLHRALRWSLTGGFYYRPEATIGDLFSTDGRAVGPAVQLGAALSYANLRHRFALGPELLLHSTVTGGNAFKRDHTSLELLLGAHYNAARLLQLGLAAGLGALRDPGTPDFRLLFRLAYAPSGERKEPDQDRDGIVDRLDACPREAGAASADPRQHGCPADRDGDGVLDRDDACPMEHATDQPDPEARGCPLRDRDHDRVPDRRDLCPEEPQGATPDPQRLGCPAGDRDKDGVLDPLDLCPDQPRGVNPDLNRPGCPLPDQDRDLVPDVVDACPTQPGAPHPNPRKNGCPGLVVVQDNKLAILEPVFFASDEDIILQRSFPVLRAVADALQLTPGIRKVRIEGHTDASGELEYNMDLSQRRANSVLRYLVERGIDGTRLEARGFGPTQPLAPNETREGRAKNRRVEFILLQAPQSR